MFPRFMALAVCAILGGCAPPPAWTLDRDEDGFSPEDGDCDDADPAVHPNADEVCDDLDNDCDGEIDEADAIGAAVWYADADGDGHGTPGVEQRACERPAGFASSADDCDDTNPAAHPGAREVWYDGVDQACDGGDDYDADGDGFPVAEDCDDHDPDVNPGASEIWYDDVDQDCDGASDHDADGDGWERGWDSNWDCDDTDASIYPGAPDAWYDEIDSNCDGARDTDQDGDNFDIGEDCDDEDPNVFPRAVERCDGVRNDCEDTGWSLAKESGTAVYHGHDGFPTDVTAELTGSSDAPAVYRYGNGLLELCDGHYFARIVVIGGGENTIRGPRGASATVLDAGRAGPVITSEFESFVTVEGLTITNGWREFPNPRGRGGGIFAEGHLTVIDSVITGNGAEVAGGIYAQRDLQLARVVFRGNSATLESGGLDTRGSSMLEDVEFEANTALNAGGMSAQGTHITILGGRFVGNTGGAINVRGASQLLRMSETEIRGNSGYAIVAVGSAADAVFRNVVVEENASAGYALRLSNSKLTLVQSSISSNDAGLQAADGDLTCEDSAITGNRSGSQSGIGGVEVLSHATFVATRCDFGDSPVDHNVGADVRIYSVGDSSNYSDLFYGNNATFACGLGACNP